MRPVLHAIIVHCSIKLAQNAPPDTLTDPYTQFLPEAQQYLDSMIGAPKSITYLKTVVGSVRYLIFLLEYSLL